MKLSNKKNQKKGCTIASFIFMIVCIIILIVVIFIPNDDDKTQKKLQEQEKLQEQASEDSSTIRLYAIATAEVAIQKELECPSTAKFDQDNCKIIYFSGNKKGDTIRVLMPFDAQNLFGAYLRDMRFVDMKLTGNFNNSDNYQVIRVLSSTEAEKIDNEELGITSKYNSSKHHSKLKYKGE